MSLTDVVGKLLELFLPAYEGDREELPLWTYDRESWEALHEPWVERVQWSPGLAARSLLGQASGFDDYLAAVEFSEGQVKWLEGFGEWPRAQAVMEGCEGMEGRRVVTLPLLIRAHVAALYAARGQHVPAAPDAVQVPEPPYRLEEEGLVQDVRQEMEAFLEALEDALGPEEEGGGGWAKRLVHDHSRRLAHTKESREFLEKARELNDPDNQTLDALWWFREEMDRKKLVDEVLARSSILPGLRGGRKIGISNEALRRLYEEALAIVRRHRDWKPPADQVAAVMDVILDDPEWRPGSMLEQGTTLWRERIRRDQSRPTEHQAVRLATRYARWLRFPWLDHPEPEALRNEGDKRAARALLSATIAGHPPDSTLQNYLSRARQGQARS